MAETAAGVENPEHAIQLAEHASGTNLDASSSRNLIANLDLLNDQDENRTWCMSLLKAAKKGDRKAAERLLADNPRSILCMAITKAHQTALHVAVGARQITFVKWIIKLMEPEDLLLQDENGDNAFFVAVVAGNVEIAKAMLSRNPHLLSSRGSKRMRRGSENTTPIYKAVLHRQKKMAKFLWDRNIISFLTPEDQDDLFLESIKNDFYDIALRLLESKKQLAFIEGEYTGYWHEIGKDMAYWEEKETAFLLLAQKSSFIFKRNFICKKWMSTQALKFLKYFWEVVVGLKSDRGIEELIRGRMRSCLFLAAKSGNFPFLAEVIRSWPDVACLPDEFNRSIFHTAILYRQIEVFNLIHDIPQKEDFVNYEGEYMLHLAAKLPDLTKVSGSGLSNEALEMQQELIFFEEVEKLIPPSSREARDGEGLTAREVFTRVHKGLAKSGAQWMKSTASSCMVVATLIATVVFSAAFTVPGGYDEKTGMTLFLKKPWFRVFAMSNAIALSSSSFAILMFLSITTSGFAQTDFRISLPLKLMIAILALFLSVTSMMVTFSSSYFLLYHVDGSKSIPIISLILVSGPIMLFVLLQYPLVRDIILLTYRSGILRIDRVLSLLLNA